MRDWTEHVRPRLSSLRLSPAREEEIVEELSQHLEDRWLELKVGGASDEDATRLALAEFREGNLLAQYMAPLQQAQTPEPITPGVSTGHLLRDVWQDLRYATRVLRKQPAFTLAVVLTLGLGIGATTAMFTVVEGVLLSPLPYPNEDRIVRVAATVYARGWGTGTAGIRSRYAATGTSSTTIAPSRSSGAPASDRCSSR